MGAVIGIDPAKHGFAFAAADERGVFSAGEVENPNKLQLLLFDVSEALWVIEKPQIYMGPAQKGDQNDLIDVALTAGRASAQAKTFEFIKPRQWKGNVKKKVMTSRILAKLSEKELKLLDDMKKNHNIVDAVGIALWRLGRLR